MHPLPEAFVQSMANWLGAEWPLLRDALDHCPERGVRLHRVGGPGPARTDMADPSADRTLKEEASLRLTTKAVWSVATAPLPVPEPVRRELADEVPWLSDAFYIASDARLGVCAWHETGAYYLQEPSAMAVAAAVDAMPGERVLDLCAAPGGKAGALGRMLGMHGVLVVNEIDRQRCRVLVQNMERLGLPAVVLNEHPEVLAEVYPGEFDAVLVDAPCSGEGMFRKDPQARSAWSPAAPEGCAARQRRILASAVRMVRPGGRLVYSTCTFNPIENEQVVAWALDELPVELDELPDWPGWQPGRPDWADGREALRLTRRLWPHLARGEGHFIARFRVLDAPPRRSRTQAATAAPGNVIRRMNSALIDAWVTRDCAETWVAAGRLITAPGNLVCWLPDGTPHLERLNVMRAGIPLARLQGQRWLPHHALAMALAPGAASQPLALDEREALHWLAGEPLPRRGLHGGVWVHIGGLPLGFGHAVSDRVNNLVPKGLRRRDLRVISET